MAKTQVRHRGRLASLRWLKHLTRAWKSLQQAGHTEPEIRACTGDRVPCLIRECISRAFCDASLDSHSVQTKERSRVGLIQASGVFSASKRGPTKCTCWVTLWAWSDTSHSCQESAASIGFTSGAIKTMHLQRAHIIT